MEVTQKYLMIQHEQKGAFNVDITGPFHLETIRLLCGGHPVPLEESSERKLECFQLKLTLTRTSSMHVEWLGGASRYMFLK